MAFVIISRFLFQAHHGRICGLYSAFKDPLSRPCDPILYLYDYIAWVPCHVNHDVGCMEVPPLSAEVTSCAERQRAFCKTKENRRQRWTISIYSTRGRVPSEWNSELLFTRPKASSLMKAHMHVVTNVYLRGLHINPWKYTAGDPRGTTPQTLLDEGVGLKSIYST